MQELVVRRDAPKRVTAKASAIGRSPEVRIPRCVGLDVELRATALCILEGSGAVRLKCSIRSEVDEIARCLAGFGGLARTGAIRAGTLTPGLIHGLRAAGLRVGYSRRGR